MHLLSALRLLLVSVQKRCPLQGLSKNQQNSGRVGRVGRGEGRERERDRERWGREEMGREEMGKGRERWGREEVKRQEGRNEFAYTSVCKSDQSNFASAGPAQFSML